MPFVHIDEIVSTSKSSDLIELFNLSFGAGQNINNTFEVIKRLRNSRPMQRCLSLLLRDPASRDMIKRREPVPPYYLENLLLLPKGTVGRTLAEIARVLDYDLNFYPKPDFFHNLETDADYVNDRVIATHDIHHVLSGFALTRA
jgi:ubiquinone biosynthesis protein Coq4